ncbi:hypothetical protein Hanom_Chr16g01429541 [Helianthus anomalus]
MRPMKQNFLDDMALWCYDLDSHEAIILFKGDKENFRMLDPMWIVNMSASCSDMISFMKTRTHIKHYNFNALLVSVFIEGYTPEASGR